MGELPAKNPKIIRTMSFLDRFLDHSPALRCSRSESVGTVVAKRFTGDAGFGDCQQEIAFEFVDANDLVVAGRFIGTESSFHRIQVGDEIAVRYLAENSSVCAPTDSLGIICPGIDQRRSPSSS